MPGTDRIVLVGHCSFDAASLRHAASGVPGVTRVDLVNDQAGFEAAVEDKGLLLINRVLDGRFEVDHGIDLLRRLAERGEAGRAMLISDFPEAQAQAVAAGALPGFGKSQTHSPGTAKKLAEAVAGLAG